LNAIYDPAPLAVRHRRAQRARFFGRKTKKRSNCNRQTAKTGLEPVTLSMVVASAEATFYRDAKTVRRTVFTATVNSTRALQAQKKRF